MKAIKLIGCKTYTYFPRGMMFESGKVNLVDDAIADVLLADSTDQGMPYFILIEQKDAKGATPAKEKPPIKKGGKARRKAPAKAKKAPHIEEEETAPVGDPDEVEDPSTEGSVTL